MTYGFNTYPELLPDNWNVGPYCCKPLASKPGPFLAPTPLRGSYCNTNMPPDAFIRSIITNDIKKKSKEKAKEKSKTLLGAAAVAGAYIAGVIASKGKLNPLKWPFKKWFSKGADAASDLVKKGKDSSLGKKISNAFKRVFSKGKEAVAKNKETVAEATTAIVKKEV